MFGVVRDMASKPMYTSGRHDYRGIEKEEGSSIARGWSGSVMVLGLQLIAQSVQPNQFSLVKRPV